ncbi:MAG: septal ring lytic transglycosylase RlpA family protein [Georgfuchsia sp.]
MLLPRLISLSCLVLLAACSSLSPGPAPVGDPGHTPTRGGGYYKDDGPGNNPPANLEAVPDAVPKAEPLHRFANKPYSVLGHDYTPLREAGHYKARGLASWYGKKFHGQKTSTGEVYDMYAMTAAHTTLPLPSYARVTSLANGKSVVVRVNDRGPFHADRIIDLSYTAAWKLGLIGSGSGMVEVESLTSSSPLAPPALIVAKSEDDAPGKVAEDKPLPEIDDARGAWLQLGAFGNRDNAEAFKARLGRELGEDMGNKLVMRAADHLFRVQLGPWADAGEARNMAVKLAELLDMKPVLVQK